VSANSKKKGGRATLSPRLLSRKRVRPRRHKIQFKERWGTRDEEKGRDRFKEKRPSYLYGGSADLWPGHKKGRPAKLNRNRGEGLANALYRARLGRGPRSAGARLPSRRGSGKTKKYIQKKKGDLHLKVCNSWSGGQDHGEFVGTQL